MKWVLSSLDYRTRLPRPNSNLWSMVVRLLQSSQTVQTTQRLLPWLPGLLNQTYNICTFDFDWYIFSRINSIRGYQITFSFLLIPKCTFRIRLHTVWTNPVFIFRSSFTEVEDTLMFGFAFTILVFFTWFSTIRELFWFLRLLRLLGPNDWRIDLILLNQSIFIRNIC